MKTAIGVDIGGTKISMVLGTSRGRILSRRVIPTRTGKRTNECIQEMTRHIAELLAEAAKKKHSVCGIGVGIPGAVNSIKGIVPRSPHLRGWKGIPLAVRLKKRFSLPVVLANDANAAAVAEKIFGHAKKCEHFIYMTVSTGVGGGIIVQGKLLEGSNFVAGEIGHMKVVPEGKLCNCGGRGCLEAYASGTAIGKEVTALLKEGYQSSLENTLAENGRVTARDAGLAARKGDKLALVVYQEAGFYLGMGIANLLNIINPQMITLGGGVWKTAPAIFHQTMMQSCKHYAWPEAFKSVRILKSKLKTDVGDLGALALIFEKHS